MIITVRVVGVVKVVRVLRGAWCLGGGMVVWLLLVLAKACAVLAHGWRHEVVAAWSVPPWLVVFLIAVAEDNKGRQWHRHSVA